MNQEISCREILDSLSAYIDHELDPSICLEIEKHMEGCAPCVAFLNTLKKTVTLYKCCDKKTELPEKVHIDLHDFLRNKIGDE